MAISDQYRALTFDVGGTIFDWHSTIRDEVAAFAASKSVEVDAAEFANDWRRGLFTDVMPKVRSGELPPMNIDGMHRIVLDTLLEASDFGEVSEQERRELNLAWHRLGAWPDAPAAIERLRNRYTVAVLTILSFSLAVDSSKHAGVQWDAIMSCEFLGHYKPAPEAYEAGVRMLGLEPSQVMMVAAHPGDLAAARNAGLGTAYVPRPGEWGEHDDRDLSTDEAFDVIAQDFPDLATQLGA